MGKKAIEQTTAKVQAAFLKQAAAHERSIVFGEMLQKELQTTTVEKVALEKKLDVQEKLIQLLKERNVELEQGLSKLRLENLELQEGSGKETETWKDKYSFASEMIRAYKDEVLTAKEEVKSMRCLLTKEQDSGRVALQFLQNELSKKKNELVKIESVNKRLAARTGDTADPATSTSCIKTQDKMVDTVGLQWGLEQAVQTVSDLALHPLRSAAAKLQLDIVKASKSFESLVKDSRLSWSEEHGLS